MTALQFPIFDIFIKTFTYHKEKLIALVMSLDQVDLQVGEKFSKILHSKMMSGIEKHKNRISNISLSLWKCRDG